MSSNVFANKNPSPAVTRRPPASNDNTVNGSQQTANRRSLSARLRNLFRKDSPSPNRTASGDRRQPTTATDRQSSVSPARSTTPTGTPQLHAPAVYWPFGKKKTKTSSTISTPKASKKKVKSDKKTKQNSKAPLEISSPIYNQENQTYIHGQNFIPRTPELMHDTSGRVQPSSSYEMTTTTKGFRDYALIDQTQQPHQVIVPDADVFTSRTYTSDRSRSPSMNNQRLSNLNDQYRYHYENLAPATSIPYPDVEVIHTPKSKRKVDDTPPSTYARIVAEKPPLSPQNPYRTSAPVQPPNYTTNPYQEKSTSSSTINTTGVHSNRSPARDTSAPKIHAPTIPFGSTSSKKSKKPKRTQSQSRIDRLSTSSTTINKLVELNPVKPKPLYGSTYGSLPDAEIIYGGSSTSLKPVKPSKDRYPGLSAIVYHHIRSPSVYVDNRPFVTTTPITGSRRPQRFETSTTTLNEREQDPSWIHPSKVTSTATHQQHDGYIRPMTPQKPTISTDVSIIRTDVSDFRDQSPTPHRPPRYDSPASSPTYRSSTTVYTRDKHLYIHGGEIKTWSSQDNGISDGSDNSYKKTQSHADIVRINESPVDYHKYQTVPPKNQKYYDEYRYSPRSEELDFKDKQQTIRTNNSDHEDVEEEERYEVTYEYQRHHQTYPYEVSKHYDEVQTINRPSNDHASDKKYPTISSIVNASVINERDNSIYQVPRSYRDSERTQASYDTNASVESTARGIHTYSLKRSDSYDGLGIFLSADSTTRLNHIIREVEPGSPGYHAGLRANDRLISINNINVENVDFENVLILIKQGFQNNNLQLSVIHEQKHI